MSYLVNDPAAFADESAEGFVAANSDVVRRVPGGVARSTRSPEGQVAVVIGGGSGHYPAFAGLVGPGLAHGAAMGNLFASPSAHQVYTVAKAAESGGGVLLTYGNYAGDVLNFNQAEARLNAEGIPCRTVVVTDDISSASREEGHKRRGIAGGLVVWKAAALAAEQGGDLDAVWAAADAANRSTRTFGVAFSGATLPGADEPLFTVEPGRMELGMGIHGEPGIDETDVPTADELADLMVDRVVAEQPDGAGSRVAVILNGLGSVKYEELFVLFRRVASALSERGLDVVEPEVGELVTSFEMAGVSLSLAWLDDALEAAWHAPAYSSAYRKGSVLASEPLDPDEIAEDEEIDAIGDASEASRAAAHRVVAAVAAARETVDEHADELGRLDQIAGDGDHGIGMQRGATAALAAAQEAEAAGAGSGTVLALAGDAWADRAGGTSGALWGLGLRAVGLAIGDDEPPTAESVARGVADARDAIMRFGKAELGDKTMLDTLLPFTDSLESEARKGDGLAAAWSVAADVADEAAASTADLVPKMGRARPHAEKSVGTPDPGAISMAQIIRAVQGTLAEGGTHD